MEREKIKDVVIDLITRYNNSGLEITEDSSIMDDLGLDSLDCVELVMDCERKFNIGVPDEDFEPMKTWTVGEFINYLQTKI